MNKIKNIALATVLSINSTGIGLANTINAATATAYTTTSVINMRTGPGTYYKSIGKLAQGKTVYVVSIDKYGWAKLNNGYYVSSLYIKKTNKATTNTSTNITTTYKYTKNALNLRKDAFTTSPKIITMPQNAKVKVLAINNNGWTKVNYNGYIGWCCSIYLNNIQQNKTVQNINKVVINSTTNKMYCYSNKTLVRTFRCATGKASTPTPKGTFKVVNKITNRPYYKTGISGGDPRNPLGKRWIGLKVGKYNGTVYAIHGTNDESSIGKNVSHGCIRMHNSEVEWLFDIISYGATVTIY